MQSEPELHQSDIPDVASGPVQDSNAEGDGRTQPNVLMSVSWNSSGGGDMTFLSGSATFGMALIASFQIFVVAGVTFNITSGGPGAKTIGFTYTGTRSAASIKSLFVRNAEAIFT